MSIIYRDAAQHCELCGVDLGQTYYVGSAYGTLGEKNMCKNCFKVSGNGVSDGRGRKVKRVRLGITEAKKQGLTGRYAIEELEPEWCGADMIRESVLKRLATQPGEYHFKQVGSDIYLENAAGYRVKTGLSAKFYLVPLTKVITVTVTDLNIVEMKQ